MRTIAAFLVGVAILSDGGAIAPLASVPFTQQAKLTAGDGAADDQFGISVSLSGDLAIIGAYADDAPTVNSGSAYIFRREGNAWTQARKLARNDAAADDLFGISVSISGDTAIVGAFLDDDGGTNSGSAYIFGRHHGGVDAWGQVVKLTAADPAEWDQFGVRVAISGDTAIVAAYAKDDAGSNSGAAYIFERHYPTPNAWGQTAKLTANDAAANDLFGYSVAISGDAAIVGAANDDAQASDSGSAYIFERNQGGANGWGQVAKLVASDAAAGDVLGVSVSISDDLAIVGANGNDDAGSSSGSAYIFRRDQAGPGAWGEVAKLTAPDLAAGDLFGGGVSINGSTAVVGAYAADGAGTPDSGAVYIFGRDQGVDDWGQVGKVTASDAAASDAFGSSVSTSGDTIVIGAYANDDAGISSGSAYVFVSAPDADGDGLVDSIDPDDDQDGRDDVVDNCVLAPNADQTDRDGDGIGAACDPVDVVNGPIAFESTAGGAREILLLHPDGTLTNLTNDAAPDAYPAWSADGTKLAFSKSHEIWRMNSDGLGATRLTFNSTLDVEPAWSPDATRIAFASSSGANYAIYVMNAVDGGDGQQLTSASSANLDPAWSPDGASIAFSTNREGDFDIYVMDVNGDNQRPLTSNTDADLYPAWSPDGSKIAFHSNRDGDHEIFVMDADGSNVVQLTYSNGDDAYAAWSPDGTKVAFASLRNGNWDVYVMDAAPNAPQTRLTTGTVDELSPSWAPASVVDTDGDGLADNYDPDDDGDDVPDASDEFPLDRTESVDTNADGEGNNADPDDDGDGVADVTDTFPLDDAEWADSDEDGLGNNADPDDDDDLVPDEDDALPLDSAESVDSDMDGTGDNADPDDDGDDVADASGWSARATLPTARLGPAAGVIDGKLFVAAGLDAMGQATSATYVYDPETDTWTSQVYNPATNTLVAVPPISMALYGAASGVIGGKLYVAGGHAGGNIRQLQIYDGEATSTSYNLWLPGPEMPEDRAAAAGVVFDRKLYVGGGRNAGNTGQVDTLFSYDPASGPAGTWSVLRPMPTARDWLGAAMLRGKLYFVGGREPGDVSSGKLEIYDPETDTWTSGPSMPTPRWQLGVVVADDVLYAIGGQHNNAHLDVVEAYDPDANEWTTVAPVPGAHTLGSFAVADRVLYATGGYGAAGSIGSANHGFHLGDAFLWDESEWADADRDGVGNNADPDADGDGIDNGVDNDSLTFSNGFGDVSAGGTTSGRILKRGGWDVRAMDVNPGGIQTSVEGAGTLAALATCAAGGAERIELDADGETVAIECVDSTGVNTGSSVLAVSAGPTIVVRDASGVEKASPSTGQWVIVGSPVTAGPTSPGRILVELVDADDVPFGSFELDAGESVDVELVPGPTGEPQAQVMVKSGTVEVSVFGHTETLTPDDGSMTFSVDVTPPVVTATSIDAEATGPDGATVVFSPSAVDDRDGVVPTTCVRASGSTFPLGVTSVTCTAADAHGNSGSATFTVTVRDTTAPTINDARVDRPLLWPPNHRLVDVLVAYQVRDLVDPSPQCRLAVASNEPENGTGDGDTAPDWQVVDGHFLRLRAERAGGGTGRQYAIRATCTDAAGNRADADVFVKVPRDQGR